MSQNQVKDVDLPVTVDEFNAFYKDVIQLTGFEDKASYKQYIATIIMHLPETCKSKPIAFFADALHKRLANEAAYAVIEEVRASEKAEQELLKLKLKQEEVTTDITPDSPLLDATPEA